MAHVRRASSHRRRSPSLVKFPDFLEEHSEATDEESFGDISRDPSPHPNSKGLQNGLHSSKRWPSRKSIVPDRWAPPPRNASVGAAARMHTQQKSLGEAIRTVRTRNMSISENAVEIAESLKAPVSYRLVVRTQNVWQGLDADLFRCSV